MSQDQEKHFFIVGFDEKDDAKSLGARFDGTRKLWYAPDEYVREALAVRWKPAPAGGAPPPQQNFQPAYGGQQGQGYGGQDVEAPRYEVPFDDNSSVKEAGARFDGVSRKWYAPDATVAALMDQRWQRVESGGGNQGGGYQGSGYQGQAGGYQGGGYQGGGYQPRGQENTGHQGAPSGNDGKVLFKVSFDEKDEAKALGARWDPAQKSWYADSDHAVHALSARFARR